MSYYANYLEDRWDPIDHNRVLTAEIDDLIVEIETSGDGILRRPARAHSDCDRPAADPRLQ
jgi:hypothetical protein